MSDEGKIVAGTRVYIREGAHSHTAARSAAAVSSRGHTTHHSRWMLKISLVLLLICALIWSWQKLTNPAVFPVRAVQIRGNYNHVDHTVLRQTVLPFIQKGWVNLDESALQDRLQQIPWVNSVSVHRALPGKLIITLTEQTPIARLTDTALLNNDGEIFSVDTTTVPAGLPLFTGPAGQQKIMLDEYRQIAAIVLPLHLQVTNLTLDERHSWALQLSNGIVVLLGKVDALPRLTRFVQVYSQVIGSQAATISSVDLRYSNGVAVRFKTSS